MAVKQEHPLDGCSFSRDKMSVRIGDAELDSHRLKGSARHNGHELRWCLGYEGEPEPLLFETPARDPVALAITGGLLLGIALAASLVPGARAARVDPLRALRSE